MAYYLRFTLDKSFCYLYGLCHRITKNDLIRLRLWIILFCLIQITGIFFSLIRVAYTSSLIILYFLGKRVEESYEFVNVPLNIIDTSRVDFKTPDLSYVVITGSWRGNRKYMEDRILDCSQHHILGVFDGHGGSDVSNYLVKRFESVYANTNSLYLTFKKLESEIKREKLDGGSTGIVVRISDSKLESVSIGDSEAWVLTKSGKIKQLNQIQSFLRFDEYLRYVKALQGTSYSIKKTSVMRTITGLMPTRSFGDLKHKKLDPNLLSEPEIHNMIFDPRRDNWEMIVIGSDGIFDGLNVKRIMNEMRRTKMLINGHYDLSTMVVNKLMRRLHSITCKKPDILDKIKGCYGGDNCSICIIIRANKVTGINDWIIDETTDTTETSYISNISNSDSDLDSNTDFKSDTKSELDSSSNRF